VPAEPATVPAGRVVYLEGLYTPFAQEAGQFHAEAAAALDTGAVQRSKLLRPSHQRSVAGLHRRHGLVAEALAEAVEGDRDVRRSAWVSTPRTTTSASSSV
jgi:hypothetical protein